MNELSPDYDVAQELIAEPIEELVEQYKVFANFIQFKPRRIYHPCSAHDISATIGFPDSKVIYADKDEKMIAAIQKSGLGATVADATQFDPGDVDLVILLNPGISPDVPISHLVGGGYVLCNDHHEIASELHLNNSYEFLGGISRNAEGYFVDIINPESYWVPVETEEEFKNARYSQGNARYDLALAVVKAKTGKEENVLAEYKKIIDEHRQIVRAEAAEIFVGEENADEMLNELVNGDFELEINDSSYLVMVNLPNKKGTTEDIRIFRKKSMEEVQVDN